ncbi:unnamed protein product [Phytophthora lilii]|uniref:Unnamed protein product n=1 Tax=Phytophthora lilii TaxID=2077276 RepID=A0A9W6TVN5_9STRA|nr:unnamed protein product [Phytophthora lilii]
MVVSYRRAPSEVRAEREALEALRAAVSAHHSVSDEVDGHSSGGSALVVEHKLPATRIRQVEGREQVLWQDRKLWECRHEGIMTSAKQLAILYYFLRHLNASSHGGCLDQLSIFFSEQVLVSGNPVWRGGEGMKGPEPQQQAPPLSWAFLEPLAHAKSDEDRLADEEAARGPLTRLVGICANLAGWLALDSANVEMYQRFLRSYSAALLDKSRVRAGYVEAVKLMCKLVDRFTGWSEEPSASLSTSLALLSEEIMTVVFKYEHLKPLRRVLMDVLSANTMFGMHEFVAQLRSQFLLQQAQAGPARNSRLASRTEKDQTSLFDGAWAFDGHRSVVTPIRGSSATDVSLGCLLTFMRELGRITVRSVNGQSLEICSKWNVCSISTGKTNTSANAKSGMSLVLDSRQRVFSNFPSGLSTCIPLGAHTYGDYRGKIISPSSFVVEMSSWPLDSSGKEPALRWKFQVDVESCSPGCIAVKAVVEEGFLRLNIGSQAPGFQLVPFDSKNRAVEAWYPIYEMIGVYTRVE